MSNSVLNLNLDEKSTENLSNAPISNGNGNGDELWRKIWEMYFTLAQSPWISVDKRQTLRQRAKDVKQQCAKTFREANVQRQTSFDRDLSVSNAQHKIRRIVFNRNIPCCCFCLYFIIVPLISIAILCIIVMNSIEVGWLTSSSQHMHYSASASTFELASSPKSDQYNKKWVDLDHSNTRVAVYTISICLLLFMLYLIVSKRLSIRKIFISIWSLSSQCFAFRSTQKHDAQLSPITFESKILLLDPTLHHSNLLRSFENRLLLYTSFSDCLNELNANCSMQYTLFLSIATFERHLTDLHPLSHISLYVFYDGNEQVHSLTPKVAHQIQFVFPESRLIEYLRHAMILNYAKRAYLLRLQGSNNEADDNFWAASNQCRILADELEQQLDTSIGRDVQSMISDNDETIVELYLPAFTFDEPEE